MDLHEVPLLAAIGTAQADKADAIIIIVPDQLVTIVAVAFIVTELLAADIA